MEDKRTLLAFLLIGAILLLIPYYYELVGLAPKPPEDSSGPTSEGVGTDPNEQNPPERPEPQSVRPDEHPAPYISAQSSTTPLTVVPGSFVAQEIAVQTPLQELVFSTRGGSLVSARLSRHKRLDGQDVELVQSDGAGLVLAIHHGDGEEDLSGIEFATDRDRVRIGEGEQTTLRLRADLGDGRSLEKILRFDGSRYGFEMDIRYAGFRSEPQMFVGWKRGIANTEEKPGGELPGGFAGAQEIGAVAYMKEERVVADEDEEMVSDKGELSWAGVANQYFFLALAPMEDGHYRLELYPHLEDRPFDWEQYSFRVGARLHSSGSFKTLVYVGPLDYEELARYELELENGIDLGWPIIRDISKALLIVFLKLHEYIPNYGWVLIVFAVAIKILVYPLTHKSYVSMAKMQALQPKITALREKYKNDNQRLSQATMKLYKDEGVNPIGGCLPMLLQMPIFFALYRLFYNIELRQAPFVGWIGDLSRPDEILIAGFGLHVLPLLMAGAMFVQQKMTMKDPKQAMLVYLMPAFLLFIFWELPSGLVLYWTVFNILQIGQQLLVNHFKIAPQPTPVPAKKKTRSPTA